MPMVIHPRIRKGMCRLAAITALGVVAAPGVASAASCTPSTTTTPFAAMGDTSSYFLAPGGSFEASSSLPSSWVARNASVVQGNEPAKIGKGTDHQSLLINAGGSVTTPYACVDSTMPNLRFFTREVTGGSDLKVDLLVQTAFGPFDVPLADFADHPGRTWSATGKLAAPNGLTVPVGMSIQGALRFTVPSSSGAWQIDDVYVDPYRSA